MSATNKVVLIVIDGWGVTAPAEHNSVFCAETPGMTTLAEKHLATTVEAHGLAVGLPDGVMGNSEVGHLTIGAGRIDFQDLERINATIAKGTFATNPRLVALMEAAKTGTGRLHLMGLVSDGGVHSHINHLKELLKAAQAYGVPECYLHFFSDGRDTAPTSAGKYLADIQGFMDTIGYGRVATIVGRYYAMDRDKRWERVEVAYNALVAAQGATIVPDSAALAAAVQAKYASGENDEFFKPVCVAHGAPEGELPAGCLRDNDAVLFFDFRADRMREIANVVGMGSYPFDKPGKTPCVKRAGLQVAQFTCYDSKYTMPVLFPPNNMRDGLSEWLSKKGFRQFHTAETEKYAHVTFFFNGGIEAAFEGEERGLVPSPQVATYDLQPEMSAAGVADSVIEALDKECYDFIVCNFAPPDMVGHTIMLSSATVAAHATDAAIGRVAAACASRGYTLMVTADHGNCEQMRNTATGEPHTAHTAHPVPFYIQLSSAAAPLYAGLKAGGGVQDVAPTVLDVMGITPPEAMSGASLLVRADAAEAGAVRAAAAVTAADALVRAAAHGDIESVTLMLNAAGSPDAAAALASGTASVAPTTLGLSPLGAAAARGHDDVVRALVAAKADVNAFSGADPVAPQTHSGLMTPVMLAAACGHAATVRALLALGADAKRARPADGADALTAAATRGEAAGIEAVLCAGGDDAAAVKAWVNTASPLGWTPLMLAGLAGNEGGVRTLLAAGADATAQTGKGETALSWASRTGRAGAINALKEAMATEGEKTA